MARSLKEKRAADARWQRAYRHRRISAPVPLQHRVCHKCFLTHPQSAFDGARVRCRECVKKAKVLRSNKRQTLRLHHDLFIAERPMANRLYQFQHKLRSAWRSGRPAARAYLRELGWTPPSPCCECGDKRNPQTFTADYSKPWSVEYVCAAHRRLRSIADERTVEQMTADLRRCRVRMLEIREELSCLMAEETK